MLLAKTMMTRERSSGGFPALVGGQSNAASQGSKVALKSRDLAHQLHSFRKRAIPKQDFTGHILFSAMIEMLQAHCIRVKLFYIEKVLEQRSDRAEEVHRYIGKAEGVSRDGQII